MRATLRQGLMCALQTSFASFGVDAELDHCLWEAIGNSTPGQASSEMPMQQTDGDSGLQPSCRWGWSHDGRAGSLVRRGNRYFCDMVFTAGDRCGDRPEYFGSGCNIDRT